MVMFYSLHGKDSENNTDGEISYHNAKENRDKLKQSLTFIILSMLTSDKYILRWIPQITFITFSLTSVNFLIYYHCLKYRTASCYCSTLAYS